MQGLAPAFTSRATLVAAPLTPLDPPPPPPPPPAYAFTHVGDGPWAGLPRAGAGMCTEGGGGDVWLQPGVDHQCHNCHVCDDRTALPFDALCPRPTVIPGELRPHCAPVANPPPPPPPPPACIGVVTCEVRGLLGVGGALVRLSHDGGASWSLGGAPFSFWSGLDDIAPAAGPAAGGQQQARARRVTRAALGLGYEAAPL